MRKTVLPLVLGVSLLGAGGATTGCSDDCSNVDCAPCPEPVTLLLTDEAGGVPAIDPASISFDGAAPGGVGIEGGCVAETDAIVCTLPSPAETPAHGEWTIVITAPGFQEQTVTVTVAEDASDDCCSCGYVAEEVAVTLTASP
jgi:hypothetical protein